MAVAGMALVNLQDPFRPGVAALEHAEWSGLTLADLVFPFFVLGVGLSVPLAVDRPEPPGAWRIVRRGAVLILWGLALNWLLHPSLRAGDFRVSGVLQRIGVVYLACALFARTWRGWRAPAVLAAALLVAHGALLLFAPAPGEAAVSLAPGHGLSGWLDQRLLPGRLRHGFDPEGVLSTLSAVAEGLVGVAAMRAVRDRDGATARIAVGGVVLAGLGGLAALALPVNKALWTPAFALLTAGLGLLSWAALRAVGTRLGAAFRGAAFLGRTALTFYVAHMLLIAALLLKPGGSRLWDRAAAAALGLAPETANLAAAIVMAGACVAAIAMLARRGWTLRA